MHITSPKQAVPFGLFANDNATTDATTADAAAINVHDLHEDYSSSTSLTSVTFHFRANDAPLRVL